MENAMKIRLADKIFAYHVSLTIYQSDFEILWLSRPLTRDKKKQKCTKKPKPSQTEIQAQTNTQKRQKEKKAIKIGIMQRHRIKCTGSEHIELQCVLGVNISAFCGCVVKRVVCAVR